MCDSQRPQNGADSDPRLHDSLPFDEPPRFAYDDEPYVDDERPYDVLDSAIWERE